MESSKSVTMYLQENGNSVAVFVVENLRSYCRRTRFPASKLISEKPESWHNHRIGIQLQLKLENTAEEVHQLTAGRISKPSSQLRLHLKNGKLLRGSDKLECFVTSSYSCRGLPVTKGVPIKIYLDILREPNDIKEVQQIDKPETSTQTALV